MTLKKMCLNRIAAAAAASFMALAFAATPAHAQIGISIGTPPPTLRYEARGVSPGPGYAWNEGYWEPFNGRYRWHRGTWIQVPYQGAYYVHPHYDHYPDGWRMHEGYWAHEDHDNHYWDKHPQKDRRDDRRDNRDDRHDDHRDH